MNNTLTPAQKSLLTKLAEAVNPLTKGDLGVAKKTLTALELVGYITSTEDEEPLWSITEAGLEAVAPKPKAEKPVKPVSDTLARCLGILADGEWHTASQLNTSHQNHGRLVEKGLAVMKQGEDFIKRFQITPYGQEVLAELKN